MVTKPFVEENCCIPHEGKEFCSGGAVVTDEYVIGYCSKDLKTLNTWQGEAMGSMGVVSSWPIHSFLSSRMYQIEAVIDGVRYTGRSCGAGMIARLKRKVK